MAGSNGKTRGTIVIRREEVVEGGHHGGAWKVAYADFVTAMMAFFLLMWLLNATTEEQRKGLADYFSQANILSRAASGSGKPFGGHTPFDDGALVSDRGAQAVMQGRSEASSDPGDNNTDQPAPAASSGGQDSADSAAAGSRGAEGHGDGKIRGGGGQSATPAVAPVQAAYLAHAASGSAPRPTQDATNPAALAAAATVANDSGGERRENALLSGAAQAIRDAVLADPTLADIARQLRVDVTPEGLRIQILDAERQPMFATGSADLDARAKTLLHKIVPMLNALPQMISVTGHTDAAPFRDPGRSNWELSSERANATRRVLAEAGLAETRFASVSGRADRDPLVRADPLAAANRRIAIVVLRGTTAP